MKNIILQREQWTEELTRLWKALDGHEVEVEVEALNLGDQIEAEHVPLKGLSYDPKDDVVQLWVGDIDHLVRQPQQIMLVQDDDDRLIAIDITDHEGVQHLVNIRQPVKLAA